jgi:hypothetical protein
MPRRRIPSREAEDAWAVPARWKPELYGWRGGPDFGPAPTDVATEWSQTQGTEGRDPATVTVADVAAILGAGDPLLYGTVQGWGRLFRVLCAVRDPAFVVEAIVPCREVFERNLGGVPELPAMRQWLAGVPDAQHEAGAATARSVFEASDEVVRQWLAFLFPAEGWWRGDARRHALFASCTDDVEQAVDLRGTYRDPALDRTLVLRFGEAFVPTLLATYDEGDSDDRREVLATLVELPWDTAIVGLFDRSGTRAVRRALTKVAKRRPRRVARLALARDDRALVDELLAAMPGLLDVLRADLDPPSLAVLDVWYGGSAGPTAAPEDLPVPLRTPPWERVEGPVLKRKALLPAYEPTWDRALADKLSHAQRAREALDEATLDAIADDPQRRRLEGLLLYGSSHPRAESALAGLAVYRMAWGAYLAEAVGALGLERAVAFLAPKLDIQGVNREIPDFVHPRIAKLALGDLGKASRRDEAWAWSVRNVEYAARAWIPVALGRPTKRRDLAVASLQALAEQAPEAVAAAIDAYDAEAAAAIRASIGASSVDVPPMPAADVSGLPAPTLADGTALPSEAVVTWVRLLACGHESSIRAVLAALDPASVVTFAAALFAQWLEIGSPSPHRYALTSLRWTADDAVVADLAARVSTWPGASRHAIAVDGLDVFVGLGSDAALRALYQESVAGAFPVLKAEAASRFSAVAAERGVDPEELADQLLPDRIPVGGLWLDYGPRQFRVRFDAELRPAIVDGDGKPRKELPKPGRRDDPALAEPAYARFQGLKAEVRSLGRLQLPRLEAAMVRGRRWTLADFEARWARHPLFGPVAQRFVWGIYDGGEVPHTCFRVTEDGTYADVQDDDVAVAGDIGLVHPIHLADLDAWGALFADYELVQPFPQLGRSLGRLSPDEVGADAIVRSPEVAFPAGRALTLCRHGWTRAEIWRNRASEWIAWPLDDGHEIRICFGLPGLPLDDVGQATLTVSRIVVCKPSDVWGDRRRPLSTLSTARISEVLGAVADLQLA